MNGLALNEDNSHFFGSRPPEAMTVEGCRELVDHYAVGQVRQILFCPNAKSLPARFTTARTG